MLQFKILIIALAFTIPAAISATEYINLDFETVNTGLLPESNTPYPVWTVPISGEYGPGNFFEVTSATSHNGNNSLRFSYTGKNDTCNTCGTVTVVHKEGEDGVDYFVADTGEDLTLEQEAIINADGNPRIISLPHAKPGSLVYNRSRGYSLWEVTSIVNDSAKNDKLLLKPLKPGIGDYANLTPIFNGGDKAAIARQCGVDGIVATSGGKFIVDRRSDCNSPIIWFGNVTAQAPGSSIFRRVYLKAEVTSPLIHQKLHYLRPDRGGPNQGEIVIFADSIRNPPVLEPILTGFGRYGDFSKIQPGLGNGFDGLEFERGVWYYMEEEYKAATQDLVTDPTGNTYNSDGEYRLWFSKSSEATTTGATPTLNITNLALPPIRDDKGETHISLWGNNQHTVHTRGHWYMDDIIISDAPIGPASTPGSNNTSPPNPPAVNN